MHDTFMVTMKLAYRSLALLLPISLLVSEATLAAPNDITRASVDSDEAQSSGDSSDPSISETGRYVAFSSAATSLVASDGNGKSDIFVRDRTAGTTSRVSVATAGTEASGGDSTEPAIGADGRYVVFVSAATNLVASDGNGKKDIFLRDTNLNTTTIISRDTNSGDSDNDSSSPSVSEDGRFVVFASTATDLVASDTNGVSDIFLYDSQAAGNKISRISLDTTADNANGASSAPVISSDGAYIAYESLASDIVASDTLGKKDIFLYNRVAGTTVRISLNADDTQGNADSSSAAISSDGRYIAFDSEATNLVVSDSNSASDIFRYDRQTDTIIRVSLNSSGLQVTGNSFAPAISQDGSVVAFLSDATSLISGDTNNTAADGVFDVFVYDTSDGSITRENITLEEIQRSGTCGNPAIDDDGSVVAFDCEAENLVPTDSNDSTDVFVTDTACPTDSDSDATVDCSDGCPTDATKTAAGVCGCGTAETDTDSDGTLDCDDECDSDASKSEEGSCGCGVADTDSNGNGAADCLDPTASTVPSKPTVVVLRPGGRRNLRVLFPSEFEGVTYKVTLKRNGKVVARRNTTAASLTFRNLSSGRYRVRYKVELGDVESLASQPVTVNL